jgi:hypothetical protein
MLVLCSIYLSEVEVNGTSSTVYISSPSPMHHLHAAALLETWHILRDLNLIWEMSKKVRIFLEKLFPVSRILQVLLND